MPRIRTLKPEILEDEKTSGLTDSAFRLFVSMVILADDYGNVRGNEQWLRGVIWWSHKSSPRVAETLREIQHAQLVDLYAVRGEVYCHIRGWDKHQRVDNAGKNRVPKHDDKESTILPIEDDDSPQDSANFRESPRNSAGSRPPTSDPDQDPEVGARGGSPRSRTTVCPDSWSPDRSEANLEAEAKASARGVDLAEQLKSMRDWSRGAGAKGKKSDWDATWRNWLRNSRADHRASKQTDNGMAELRALAEGNPR